jgi:phage FluMu protein Com
MSIEITCTGCGKVLLVPDAAAGKKGKCPHCGTILQVPVVEEQPLAEEVVLQPPSELPANSDTLKSRIFLNMKGQKQGPYLKSQVQNMWNNGVITADSFYWHEGMREWEPVSKLISDAAIETPPVEPPSKARPSRVRYDSRTETFEATLPLMMRLAMRAVQDLDWKLDNANETLGLVTFQTGTSFGSFGGIGGSLAIEEVAENQFRVTGTGKQNMLTLDLFGEAKGKANKVIRRMIEIALS